jgi:hypothetical protein
MLQFPISFDEVAKGFNNFIGVRADKRVEAQVQIADVPAKLDVLDEFPHF